MERISLTNSAFEGNNNVYLFANGPETVLVDTGDWRGTTRTQLEDTLDEYGVAFSDIGKIFLTHWHLDHSGLAGVIQAESGADVYAHTRDAPLVAGDEQTWTDMHDQERSHFETWNIPEEKQAVLRDYKLGPQTTETLPDVTTFGDGDVFSFNGIDLTVVHTPGHADGLCMFEIVQEGDSVILSGDTLLPEYTPNVGGADIRVEKPLDKYLQALQSIVDADYDRAWPGHRDAIDDPKGRAQHIISHHEKRAWRILDVLDRNGPCDTWLISQHLFGELDGIHILHGPGECYAHLEHLEREGTVIADGEQYQLATGVSEKLAEYDQYWPLQ